MENSSTSGVIQYLLVLGFDFIKQDTAFLLTNEFKPHRNRKKKTKPTTHFFFLCKWYEVWNTSHICYSRLSTDSWKNTAS